MKPMLNPKKGQVTIFIIVGIILVVAITMGIILRKDIAQKIQDVKISQSTALQQEVDLARPFVEDCLQSSAENAVLKVVAKGGYNAPRNSVEYDYYTVPIYFNKGKETVPSMQNIASEIALAIKNEVPSCANFKAAGMPVKAVKRPEVSISVGKKIITVDMEWPLTVGNEQESATISEFSASIPADIESPYEYTMALYNQQKAIKVLSLIDLARLAKQNNFILHFDMADNDAMVYLLTFNRTIIQRQPLVYTFGIIREKPKAGESTSLLSGAGVSGTAETSSS
ncbi:MAG: hypothetical protein PHO02_06765 [Candidatus Nanoarchaeia archaeon]|nr:hypothetical protein [Candidatus Nanoarchaeia archaeon]